MHIHVGSRQVPGVKIQYATHMSHESDDEHTYRGAMIANAGDPGNRIQSLDANLDVASHSQFRNLVWINDDWY